MKESTIELQKLNEAHQPLLQQHDVVGSAVTLGHFRNAIMIIERYNEQITERRCSSAKKIGCLVTLSAYGKKVDKENKEKRKKLKGKVIDWLDWCSTPAYEDGLVTIKWEGISIPETRHISQVKPVGYHFLQRLGYCRRQGFERQKFQLCTNAQ